MKPQQYPASIIKVGAVLYRAVGWTDDDGKCHLDIDEWHVRSIQNRTISKYLQTKRTVINLVHKCEDITWSKGKWINNIPSKYRQKFYKGETLPTGLYTTSNQALKFELLSTIESIRWYENEKTNGTWSKEHEEEYAGELRLLKVVKSRITRHKNKNKK